MKSADSEITPVIGDRRLYDRFMTIARNRITTRQFDSTYEIPDEHYELILEAARHAPSGANAQPWHYIIVRDQEVRPRHLNGSNNWVELVVLDLDAAAKGGLNGAAIGAGRSSPPNRIQEGVKLLSGGSISLQAESHPVEFRHVELRELRG